MVPGWTERDYLATSEWRERQLREVVAHHKLLDNQPPLPRFALLTFTASAKAMRRFHTVIWSRPVARPTISAEAIID